MRRRPESCTRRLLWCTRLQSSMDRRTAIAPTAGTVTPTVPVTGIGTEVSLGSGLHVGRHRLALGVHEGEAGVDRTQPGPLQLHGPQFLTGPRGGADWSDVLRREGHGRHRWRSAVLW